MGLPYRPTHPAATVGGPATPPPAPIDRGGQASPSQWAEAISMPVKERDEFDRALNASTVQWVELPDALIQRLYALDLGPEADDLADRIEVLVVLAEVPDPVQQCSYEAAPDSEGFVLRCLRNEGHDGPHTTRRDLTEVQE